MQKRLLKCIVINYEYIIVALYKTNYFYAESKDSHAE